MTEIEEIEEIEEYCQIKGLNANEPPFIYIRDYFRDIRQAYENGYKEGVKSSISDATTNGDMIKLMFPNATIKIDDFGTVKIAIDDLPLWRTNIEWWNKPYNKGENIQ